MLLLDIAPLLSVVGVKVCVHVLQFAYERFSALSHVAMTINTMTGTIPVLYQKLLQVCIVCVHFGHMFGVEYV